METLFLIARLIVAVVIAIVVGKMIGKVKLPAILGFLITGMILGPYALNVMSLTLTNSHWYHVMSQLFELSVGLLFAKELVIKKMKAYGKQVITITAFESIGTFVLVTLVFGILFYFMNIPLYVAVIFGGIALATAPAPSLSIVNEYKTNGELTRTLIPVAIMDDVVAIVVFFTINALIASMGSVEVASPLLTVIISIGAPIVLGIILGYIASTIYNKTDNIKAYAPMTIFVIVGAYVTAFFVDNYVLPAPSMNYMLIGMALFTVVTNKVTEEKMEQIVTSVAPLVSIGLVVMILNLSAPLDYRLIFSAGILTFVYIIARGLGKYFCTYLGAKVSGASPNIRKYLGLTFLPHSGVSLIFTGMAVTSLTGFDSESAVIVQGTIAAAAVINEIFAVILAKKGFELAGEIGGSRSNSVGANEGMEHQIITINRQFGSGGREVGKRLADRLEFAYYDKEIFRTVAKESEIDTHYVEKFGETSASRQIPLTFVNSFSEYSQSLEDKIKIAQNKVLKELSKQGNSVIIGRCGNYILKDKQPFSVFIYASDMDTKINRCYEKNPDDKKKSAKEMEMEIMNIDKRRSDYYLSVTGKTWNMIDNYNLCIDTSVVGIEKAVELIVVAFQEYSSTH